MPKPSNRIAAHTDESCQDPATGEFYLQFIMENEAGYVPSRLTFPTLAEAQTAAARVNKQLHRTPADVLAIRDSSFRKGKVRQ